MATQSFVSNSAAASNDGTVDMDIDLIPSTENSNNNNNSTTEHNPKLSRTSNNASRRHSMAGQNTTTHHSPQHKSSDNASSLVDEDPLHEHHTLMQALIGRFQSGPDIQQMNQINTSLTAIQQARAQQADLNRQSITLAREHSTDSNTNQF